MKKIIYLFVLGLFTACSNDPQPIDYGNDHCNFCEMTIVSQAYSAQAVSQKGKQYKYDAIECMVNDQLQHKYDMSVNLVANFEQPGTMVDVNKAGFVINDSIKSPMGGNLAAFKKESLVVNNEPEGTFSWEELLDHFLENDSLTTSYQ
ncbi:nitrous oxide reductase accessory protein NosL [Salegentibacter sp. JZCK2]|uniref:nitrous oxide reductase accessory protein NosL n=1 Tax=Salegentibacter tibetensis TaxID=2873600 RepID=UPI001CC9752A|nr:nitrous oxide reductase accessory protein NosL [Salegentibacter tibetensis]MBZ9728726.1 nitrous oxide reductase accessory protein NosL [Salegentibacter tibetensis]